MNQGFPPIHGIALLGGFLWCNGNMLCPLAIKFIGLGQALILWGCMSLLFGWASGTFGLFGLRKQHICNPTLNYIGVSLCVVRLLIYLQVKTTPEKDFDDSEAGTEIEGGCGWKREGVDGSMLLGAGYASDRSAASGAHADAADAGTVVSPLSKKALDASCEDLSGLARTMRFLSESSHNTETGRYSYTDGLSAGSRMNSVEILMDVTRMESPGRGVHREAVESKAQSPPPYQPPTHLLPETQPRERSQSCGMPVFVDIENEASNDAASTTAAKGFAGVNPMHPRAVSYADRPRAQQSVQAAPAFPTQYPNRAVQHRERQQSRGASVDVYAWYVRASPADTSGAATATTAPAALALAAPRGARTGSFASDHTSTTVAAEIGHRLRAFSIVMIGDDWNDRQRRLAGILLAVLAGSFFGVSFDPSQYVIDNRYDGNDRTLNYVFSHYLGILLTSWVYTIIYFSYHSFTNQRPFISESCILPATLSGLIWGTAMAGWFVANGELGFPITFPIVSAGPGFIGALWSIFVFREITDWKNIRTLLLAFLVTVPALTVVALSH